MVLEDSEQIRRTLQGFESVLKDMARVCDVSSFQQDLTEADQRVVDMQNNLLEFLSKLEQASAVSTPKPHTQAVYVYIEELNM